MIFFFTLCVCVCGGGTHMCGYLGGELREALSLDHKLNNQCFKLEVDVFSFYNGKNVI